MPLNKLSKKARCSLFKEMPSRFEQDVAEAYCCDRKILRPNTSLKKLLIIIVITEGLIVITSFILHYLFYKEDAFIFLPEIVLKIKNEGSVFFFVFVFLCINAIVIFLGAKFFLIEMVKLYQRYATEDVRRRCLFKPTCSEYSVISLQKYGVIIGLYKTYIRVFKKCRGNIYRIDYP